MSDLQVKTYAYEATLTNIPSLLAVIYHGQYYRIIPVE